MFPNLSSLIEHYKTNRLLSAHGAMYTLGLPAVAAPTTRLPEVGIEWIEVNF